MTEIRTAIKTETQIILGGRDPIFRERLGLSNFISLRLRPSLLLPAFMRPFCYGRGLHHSRRHAAVELDWFL
jgi:hypothetical protein